MIPLSFGGCAAWLHEARGARGAVVLAPLGFEELCARHALRCLADALAARDIPTLRFDYRGTGDSASCAGGLRLEAMLSDVQGAIETLTAETGVTEIVLIGLRFGALLAPLALERSGRAARLALLAHPGSGRAYHRDMRGLSLILGSPGDSGPADAKGLTVGGFTMEPGFLSDLKTLDAMESAGVPADDVLLLSPEPARTAKLEERLSAVGASVSAEPFPGYQELMCDPTAAQVPAIFDRVADWAAQRAPDVPLPRAPRPPRREEIDGPGWREHGVVLEGGSAGIACLPADRPLADAVLFLDAGGIYHGGWAGMNVGLARRLAAAGIASLRLDFPGVGDGAPWTGRRRMTFYDAGTADHVREAVDWLDGLGAGPITVAGTCSGAHHAFHAAIDDARVSGVVMLNTLCFIWGPSYAIPLNAWKMSRPKEMASRQRVAEGGEGSATLVERVIDSSLPIVKDTVRGFIEALKTRLAAISRGGADPGEARNPVERSFRLLSARGARVSLVYGEEDPGRLELERYMGPDGAWATALPGVSLHLIPQTDHALTPAAARARYGDIVAAFVAERGLSPAAGLQPSPARRAANFS